MDAEQVRLSDDVWRALEPNLDLAIDLFVRCLERFLLEFLRFLVMHHAIDAMMRNPAIINLPLFRHNLHFAIFTYRVDDADVIDGNIFVPAGDYHVIDLTGLNVRWLHAATPMPKAMIFFLIESAAISANRDLIFAASSADILQTFK